MARSLQTCKSSTVQGRMFLVNLPLESLYSGTQPHDSLGYCTRSNKRKRDSAAVLTFRGNTCDARRKETSNAWKAFAGKIVETRNAWKALTGDIAQVCWNGIFKAQRKKLVRKHVEISRLDIISLSGICWASQNDCQLSTCGWVLWVCSPVIFHHSTEPETILQVKLCNDFACPGMTSPRTLLIPAECIHFFHRRESAFFIIKLLCCTLSG